ncbi:UPF0016 family membrane protein [Shewanella sp. NFH-SH190041]|uniref:TMEM165/GDT1 family protein n=1 Tax=Shewanella sp. NFH-SH190041 TaxID=2950245 RepID=UPI0021C356F4|nr:TMEM165/GDT1 family protein [Shewanella sp. NFH-SH190041]BDM63257.1 UPF0016 family membrane protein [Shewanella sp. NFH-SH190041]
MDAFIASTLAVAMAEIGDKTQLLTLLLAARFKNKTAIISGMLIATLLNHFIAAWLGQWLTGYLSPTVTQYLVALSFFAIALWVLVPDKADDRPGKFDRFGPFIATAILFFIAEMGDKTQIATLVLAAHYQHLLPVVLGTTAGMLLANVPVVLIGHYGAGKLPLQWVRRISAVIFILLGVATLLGSVDLS